MPEQLVEAFLRTICGYVFLITGFVLSDKEQLILSLVAFFIALYFFWTARSKGGLS